MSRMASEGNPPGYEVLEQRVRMIPELLSRWCHEASSRNLKVPSTAAGFVVTGIGSSEAHGRYLVALLNDAAGIHGEFRPLSSFIGAPREVDRDRVLVVISQGLSPNSWLALDAGKFFSHVIVFTSCTEESIAARGDAGLLERYRRLVSGNCTLLRYPLANEYTILLRVVGPFFGYLACYELVRSLAATLPELNEAQLRRVFMRSEDAARQLAKEDAGLLSQGFHIIAGYPLSLYGQNLCLKFLEGVFYHVPRLWNVLDISHGLVQQLSLAKRPVWLLTSVDDDRRMLELGAQVLNTIGAAPRVIASELPSYLEVLEFEMLLNYLILQFCRRFKVNQLEWPAKGLDLPLYTLGRDGTSS